MKQGLLRSSRYSPGNMSRESLEALFVGRHEIMEDVLSRLVKSIQGVEKHYLLLIGPRGSGKTHFIALLRHRLMDQLDDADVHDTVLVAELNEEEWGVVSFLDLIVRILKSLGNQTPNFQTKVNTIYDIFSKDPDEAEAYAIALLRQRAQGKTLMLLCENLVDLFCGLGDEGQKKWRSVIQEDGNWTIVASTPSLFAALTLQINPFYGFFTIRQLEKIDFETALEFLATKAAYESKPELENLLRTPLGRARARAIHHLAAGNHRAYVVLFDFLDRESLDDLTTPFMNMVDDLTPYYQDRMRQLSPSQRKIVEFLCQQGIPTTIKDISIPSLMTHQTTAKQVGELNSAGFVSRIRTGRNTFCELSEPLMRICIEVKDNKTRHFRLFVEFLRHWFTKSELERRHSAFQHGDQTTRLDRVHIEEALKCSYADRSEPFRAALREEADLCFEVDDYDGLATIQATLVNDGSQADDYSDWIYALIGKGDFELAIEVGHDAAAKFPDHADIQYHLARSYGIRNQFDEALTAIDRAIALDAEHPSYHRIRADLLQDLGRSDEALTAIDHAIELDDEPIRHLWNRAHILLTLERPEEALTAIDRAIGKEGGKPENLCLRADILLDLGHFDAAIVSAQSVLDADPDHLHSYEQIIPALVSLDRLDEAEARARDLIDYAPANLQALLIASGFYLNQDRLDEALQLLQRALIVDSDNQDARRLRGHVFFQMSDYRRASEDLRFCASLYPRSVSTHCRLAVSLLQSGEWEEAAGVAEQLITIDPEHFHAYYVLGSAFAELNRPKDAVAAFDKLLSTEDCETLLIAASAVRDVGDFASAKRYLGRVAELQSDNRELWIAITRIHILEGSFDAAIESAAKIESYSGCSLLGRLFAAQAAAGTMPLDQALDALGTAVLPEDFKCDDQLHLEAITEILTVSVRSFGPSFLPKGLAKLRSQLGSLVDEGLLGRILINFLQENIDHGFKGSLPDWEKAFECPHLSLEELSDCQIPLRMLRAVLKYTKTGEERHLLRLPLEQRQLLESVF